MRTDPDPTDHRATLVSLTEAGRLVIDHAQPAIDRIENSIQASMGADDYRDLHRLLTELLAGFEEGDAYPRQ